MRNTAMILRKKLLSIIQEMARHPEAYARNPDRDFTRRRAPPFERMVFLLLTMSENSAWKVLMKHFRYKANTPSASAFAQQRQKLLPAALDTIFHRFTRILRPAKTFMGFRLLAVDGSSLKSAAYPKDPDSYRSGSERQHGWNQHHLNVLFDLENGIYTDVLVQKEHNKNESKALCSMVERSDISQPVILLADRNYESYNNLAHLQNRGWKYLIRIREKARTVAFGVKLPNQPEFDIPVRLTLGRLTKRQLEAQGFTLPETYYRITAQMPFDFLKPESSDFYRMSFRIVRIKVNEHLTETFITNLDMEDFPPSALKQLYTIRWGVETSFRDLKYAVGLINLHSKKPELVLQEIFAAFLIYDFVQAAAWEVDVAWGCSGYKRHVNFSDAVDICCAFLRGAVR